MLERARATDDDVCEALSAARCAATSAAVASSSAVPPPRARSRRPVGGQVPPVGVERSRRPPALHLEPGEVLLGRAGQHGCRHAGPPVAASRARARQSPSTVVSSLRVPSATERVEVGQLHALDAHEPLFGPVRTRRARGEAGGQEDRRLLVADPRAVPRADQPLPRRRLEARLLGQLAPGRFLVALLRPVQGAGGDLEHQGVDRGPVLADEGDRTVVVHRDDGHRAGMAHDEAVEGRAVGVFQVQPLHPEDRGPEELLPRDAAETRHVRYETASRSSRCGSRPSARSSAAATRSRKRGWGRSGRLLNSG